MRLDYGVKLYEVLNWEAPAGFSGGRKQKFKVVFLRPIAVY